MIRSRALLFLGVLFSAQLGAACSSGGTRETPTAMAGQQGNGGASESTAMEAAGGDNSGGNRDTTPATGGSGGGGGGGGGGSGGNASGGTTTTGGTKATGGTGGTTGTGDMKTTGGSGGTVATGGAGGTSGAGDTKSWLISEGFESGLIDPAKWLPLEETDGAKISVQSDQAAHGRYSLRIDIPGTKGTGGGNRSATIRIKQTPSALKGHVYARMYVRFSPSPNYKNIMYASEGAYTNFGTFSNNGARWMAQIGDSTDTGGNLIPADKWICLEAEWETGPFRVSLYVDGVAAYNRTGNTAAGFNNITLGLHTGHAPEADAKVWIDDFAMDVKRIGCL